jgi:hypothetical protein
LVDGEGGSQARTRRAARTRCLSVGVRRREFDAPSAAFEPVREVREVVDDPVGDIERRLGIAGDRSAQSVDLPGKTAPDSFSAKPIANFPAMVPPLKHLALDAVVNAGEQIDGFIVIAPNLGEEIDAE